MNQHPSNHPIMTTLMVGLHFLVAVILCSLINETPWFRWEFWTVMLSLPAVRILDEWMEDE